MTTKISGITVCDLYKPNNLYYTVMFQGYGKYDALFGFDFAKTLLLNVVYIQ